ncbi:restriction endonuclease subunit S [Clostridium perfringens]|uniref:restriction endonuclease subunit S n=1 Tax=Clostridium perfringens TaxID=1502 RepID=UPI0024BCB88F|nr:restriction endonuclease subunit S [Clostridium perfringens]
MSRNVPKLRFKGFEDEWKDEKLGDFLMKSTDVTTEHTDIPVLTSSRRGLFLQSEYFNREVAAKDTTGYNILKRGYFTYRHMSDDSTFHFNINRFIDIGLVSPEYPVFTTKQDLNSYFLEQHLNSSLMFSKFCKMQKKGGTRTRLYFKVLENYKLKLPTLQEQEKIANFLSKVDSIIEKQGKKVQYWNSYKKGMMQKIFSQKIRFKDENGMDYPEWEEEKLGGIGQTYTGLSGKTKEDFGFGNGKYITYVNIFKNTKVDINMFDLVDIKKDEKQNKVLKGDILFTASSETPNEVGMASVCDNNIENLYLNSFCFGFRLNSKNDIDYIFISYLLRSPSLRKKISILAQGSTRYNLSKSEFMKIKIQIPCLEEQRKIVNFLSNIDNIIEKESKKLEELRQWKKGLLQQMFV